MEYKASVVIIVKDGEFLLGTSTDTDFRQGKSCFVAGGIEVGENPIQAAVREAQEEAGIIVKPRQGEVYKVDGTENIVYVVCDYVSGDVNHNHEFSSMGWYGVNNLPPNILERNAQVIQKLFK